jgi:5-methylcytosine-specific restriction endonuclease McrA
MTTTERGYGYAWQRLRAAHVAANPFCEDCTAEGVLGVPVAVVDHRIPHRGDFNLLMNPDNLKSLCNRHGGKKNARERRA